MALVRNRELFTAKWQAGLKAIPESGMVALIAVYTRQVTYSNNVPTVSKTYVYGDESGAKARAQPLGVVVKSGNVGDTMFYQRVLFSIPMGENTEALVPEQMFVDVVDGGLNSELVGPVFQIREVLDSSNPFERTFVGEVETGG